ncbi:hypothetical protein ACLTEW_20090 [Gordonia lacunae]|uniref:hypothetical protein n=1 Tax=Gordonia lacunae TaxID=417102 RepID=UPI0039E2D046
MDASAIVASVAALIALVALYFTWRQVRAAEDQTLIQREIQRDASQPYVWADVRLHEQHGGFFMLLLKNEGPTVATNVTVTFDPPLPRLWRGDGAIGISDRHHPGVSRFSSLPPGRTMQWRLGLPSEILATLADSDQNACRFTVTIAAEGPAAATPSHQYVIDLLEYMDSAKTAPGTALSVVKAIEDSTKTLDRTLSKIARRIPSEEDV